LLEEFLDDPVRRVRVFERDIVPNFDLALEFGSFEIQ
jgi:hypothetical protein